MSYIVMITQRNWKVKWDFHKLTEEDLKVKTVFAIRVESTLKN